MRSEIVGSFPVTHNHEWMMVNRQFNLFRCSNPFCLFSKHGDAVLLESISGSIVGLVASLLGW
jgi:hypothetical protein